MPHALCGLHARQERERSRGFRAVSWWVRAESAISVGGLGLGSCELLHRLTHALLLSLDHERAQHRVDARLVSRTLLLEPLQHVLVHAERDGLFGHRFHDDSGIPEAGGDVSERWRGGGSNPGVADAAKPIEVRAPANGRSSLPGWRLHISYAPDGLASTGRNDARRRGWRRRSRSPAPPGCLALVPRIPGEPPLVENTSVYTPSATPAPGVLPRVFATYMPERVVSGLRGIARFSGGRAQNLQAR